MCGRCPNIKDVGCSHRNVQSKMNVITGQRRLEVLLVCTPSTLPPGIVSEEGLRGEVPPILQHQVLQLALELPSTKFSWVRIQVGPRRLTRTTTLLVVLGCHPCLHPPSMIPIYRSLCPFFPPSLPSMYPSFSPIYPALSSLSSYIATILIVYIDMYSVFIFL